MRSYEVTFLVDPVLSSAELTSTLNTYTDMIKAEGGSVVAVDELGLRQLAYQINKRNTAVYYTVEFQMETGQFIDKLELALRRDERIMRFLSVSLDKYGVKYNADKRDGKIGKVKKKEPKADKRGYRGNSSKPAPKPAPKPAAAPAPKAEPVAEKPAPAPVAEAVAETPAPVAEAPGKSEEE